MKARWIGPKLADLGYRLTHTRVDNFGGTDGTFLGQGLDEYVRVGYVEFEATGWGCIDFVGEVGPGEYSVYGRDIGEIQIRGCEVYTPEPTSILILSMGGLACLGRHRSRWA